MLAQIQGSLIGKTAQANSVTRDEENEKYILKGEGKIENNSDNFYFVHQNPVNRNIIWNTEIHWPDNNENSSKYGGIMFRDNLEQDSRFISIINHGDGSVSLLLRRKTNGNTEEISYSRKGIDILQLEKHGDTINLKGAKNGEPLILLQSVDFKLDTFFAGIFICSSTIESAFFINTRIYYPAKDNFIPYHDYIGSQLEILDINTGVRKIVYSTPEAIESPNWTPDGKAILYNCKGLLYRFDLDKNTVNPINTDFATANNNDHGISPDGKWLAISHHSKSLPDGENSLIYIVPIEGGIPRQITTLGPSYWHGWSPDGKWLIYTAKRNNRWSIYKISINGGKEIQLTDNEFLNDGPEYTPDGKTIWFNSNRTGKMQIWKMQEDGKEQLQVTNDNFNNWFPHHSPDGKKVVFLSYPPEVNSWDHPYYKQVMIRIMNNDGTDQKAIAYLYGGQGTLNVPSWSPDGTKIAFISNTEIIDK
jgi:Tol biopolymer transport system component